MSENIYQRFKKLNGKKTYRAHNQLMDSLFQQDVLQSGDSKLIVDYFDAINEPEKVLEHFGEDSPHYLFQQERAGLGNLESLVETLPAPSPKNPSPKEKRQYTIPKRGENPTLTYGMLRVWIIDFHEQNDMSLPKNFHQRNHRQLKGMFHGMQKTYHFNIKDILPEEY